MRHLEQPFVFCYDTINQREALSTLIDQLRQNSEIITSNPKFQNYEKIDNLVHSLALHYTPDLIKWQLTLSGRDRRVFCSRYYNIFQLLGQYRFLLESFKQSPKLKYYIAANDHSGISQAGFVAARQAKLKTIYIQHASVSANFPPLQTDYALLDGQDAKEKYLASGSSNTNIFLIGSMKYDKYLQSEKLNHPGNLTGLCIGIAFNDIEENLKLCRKLKGRGEPFALRFHPAVAKEIRQKFADHASETSQPEEETALDFIMRCHTIISGDSNILLEALILKRRPLYFASTGKSVDYYGFLKKGLLEKASFTAEEVLEHLKTPFQVEPYRRKAKYFFDTLYTEYEGRSTDLALEIFKNQGISIN